MLYKRRNGLDRQLVFACYIRQHAVLKAYAELSLARAYKHFGAVLGRLHDLNVKTCVGEIALFLGNIKTGVVGIWSPVKDKGDLSLFTVDGRIGACAAL